MQYGSCDYVARNYTTARSHHLVCAAWVCPRSSPARESHRSSKLPCLLRSHSYVSCLLGGFLRVSSEVALRAGIFLSWRRTRQSPAGGQGGPGAHGRPPQPPMRRTGLGISYRPLLFALFFLFLFSVLKSLFDNFCEQGLVEKPSERSALCPSRGRCLHAGREPEPGWETRFRSVQVPNGQGDRRAWAAEEGPGWTGFRSLSPAKPWGPWSGTGTAQCP